MYRKLFFILILIGLAADGYSQFKVILSPERDTVLLGDPVTFKMVIECRPGTRIEHVSFSSLDSTINLAKVNPTDTAQELESTFGDLEISGYGLWEQPEENYKIPQQNLNWDTFSQGKNFLLENELVFAFWQPGKFLMPYPAVAYSRDGSSSVFRSLEAVSIIVLSPDQTQVRVDTSGLAFIKPIIKEPFLFQDLLPVILILLGAAVLILLIRYFLRKKKTEPSPPAPKPELQIPAHVITLEKLEHLRNDKLWQQGKVKEYHTQLSYIFREYIENRFKIKALEEPTEWVTEKVRNLKLTTEQEKELRELLSISDMVKFAKAKPAAEKNIELLENAFSFVHSTKEETEIE